MKDYVLYILRGITQNIQFCDMSASSPVPFISVVRNVISGIRRRCFFLPLFKLFFPCHFQDFDTLEGLEGAIGGYDDFSLNDTTAATTDLTHLKGPRHHDRSEVQRLSESSNDSGFGYKNGFSSNSSMGSSHAGSPTGSSHGADDSSVHHRDHHNGVNRGLVSSNNGSTSGNGTERDPRGSRTLAQHQVAHNHTYNTPPGQVPREVSDSQLECLVIRFCLFFSTSPLFLCLP